MPCHPPGGSLCRQPQEGLVVDVKEWAKTRCKAPVCENAALIGTTAGRKEEARRTVETVEIAAATSSKTKMRRCTGTT